MRAPRPRPAQIAAAGVTVLASSCVAAFVLHTSPAAVSAPDRGRLAASYDLAPVPVTLSFPAPLPPAPPPAPPAPPVAAPAPVTAPPPPPAAAPADPRCSGPGWQQRRGQAAAASLRRPADARAVPVAFEPARAGVLGLTDLRRGTVRLFVRDCGTQSDALLRHVLAHELGHALDSRRLSEVDRAEWMRLRGIPASTPWYGCSGCTDFATPAGDFAETYAQWQRGATRSRSQLAPPASPGQLARLAERFFQPL